jgi:hypothetical protein
MKSLIRLQEIGTSFQALIFFKIWILNRIFKKDKFWTLSPVNFLTQQIIFKFNQIVVKINTIQFLNKKMHRLKKVSLSISKVKEAQAWKMIILKLIINQE